jgi:hypothetical protein
MVGRPPGGHIRPVPPLDKLKSILDYNPMTGVFTWTKNRRGPVRMGGVAGSELHSYIVIRTIYGRFPAHRLAWRFIHGDVADSIPGPDHIDRNGLNNAASNLRPATPQQQAFNRKHRISKVSGLRGVTWVEKAQRWRAKTQLHGKTVWLGYHDSKEEAHAAFMEFARTNHGEFFVP